MLSRAIGGVVNPVVHSVDVDDIVRRIDVDDLVQRVDIDAVLAKIDIDRLVARVDVNKLLDQVDVDRLLDRVDVDKLIQRSSLEEIVGRSTTGVFSQIMNLIRAHVVARDQSIQGMGRLSCIRSCCGGTMPRWLPPGPTEGLDKVPAPRHRAALALAVQGRNAGIVSRAVAYGIDEFFVTTSFAVGMALVRVVVNVVADQLEVDANETDEALARRAVIASLLLFLYGIAYDTICLAAVGRTLGKAILGLRVVTSHGKRLGGARALWRAWWTSFPVGVILLAWFGLIRRDRRQMHDLIAGTTVIYSWNARRFQKEQALLPDYSDEL